MSTAPPNCPAAPDTAPANDPASEFAVPANEPAALAAPDIPAKAPPIDPVARPNAATAPDAKLVAPATEDAALLTALPACCIAATVGPKPTVAAAVTIPVIWVEASEPVIAPTLPNAVCACCMVFTTEVAWAGMFCTRLVRFNAPAAPVNNDAGIA